MNPMNTPTRPALRYPGAKWTLGPWIVAHLPVSRSEAYTESFGGSAGVLIQKPRQKIETYNDLSGDIVNFFQVLRDRTDELVRLIELTPYARAEYELSKSHMHGLSSLERARRTFIYHWMSISGGRKSAGGWRVVKSREGRRTTPASDLTNISYLYEIADRFRGVQIERLLAEDVLCRYDGPGVLHYVDPPYLAETRTEKNLYHHELKSNDEHAALVELLLSLKGMVVLSGYRNDLYEQAIEARGWVRRDKVTRANSGVERIESLWLSPPAWKALGKAEQAVLI